MTFPIIPTSDKLADTRHRLLQAAGEIFAIHGYRQATIRDIIEQAEVNIAAVNYHFGDKLGLYRAVLEHWLSAALEKYPPDGGLAPDTPVEERFRAFIYSFLFRLMDEGTPAWHGKLMAREMADPTPGVIESLVETHMKPHAGVLFEIIREILGTGAPAYIVRRCAFSTVGQILFYRHCESTIQLIAPGQKMGRAEIEALAEHITRFSLCGIYTYREELKNVAKKRKPLRTPPKALEHQ